MSPTKLIEIAGGLNNIQRILIDGSNLSLSLINPVEEPLLDNNAKIEKVAQEWQLTVRTDDELNAKALELLSDQLAERHKDEVNKLSVQDCSFRPTWHISPPCGLLNDPNGFIFHQGKYHLFYQWNPFACTHKDKYWAHLTSTDLLSWQWHEPSLTPSHWYDSHGAFSGHAVSHESELYLFYTGNSRLGHDQSRRTTQCLAKSSDGIHFDKLGPIIDTVPQGLTQHFRDPKVYFRCGRWNMLLGAQTAALEGRLAHYQSDDLLNWTYQGLLGSELGDLGYMWECPDFFELSDQPFVVIGPQGIPSPSKHDTNPHQNRIFLVQDSTNNGFTFKQGWALDHGFDFYAPQTTLAKDGRRVLVGWMGLPDDVEQPSVANGWIHQLTCVRELQYVNGKIIQTPARELERLMTEPFTQELGTTPIHLNTRAFELSISLDNDCQLIMADDNQHQVVLSFASCTQTFRFDRSNTLMTNGDSIREVTEVGHKIDVTILADSSSLELFINKGEIVMSGRVFLSPGATHFSLLGGNKSVVIRKVMPCSPPFLPLSSKPKETLHELHF
ncbi:glycoside hydrolase family 32 protein [Vibrio sp. S4M6]|uniref:glycoside hydrolase family 32 protein n=1 Tax=Vibrio sinus TaxID=2946865 RepID=UPI00202A1FF5|nr:glycoside hydrolase family 32 protein [Vibrio sinus]MCL9780087.1 glycoside hydrolase family 32 protein [Vibrio sinus]